MIATKSPVLQMLNEKIDVLTLSPTERKLYESRMKLKSDITTISETQFSAGVERGLAEGSRQKALETARLMLQRNYPVSEISLMTGLTKEDVEKL